MSVLVTGGMGFIGSHIVAALLEQTKWNVVVVDNGSTCNNWPRTLAALKGLDDSSENRLHVFTADIGNAGDLDLIFNYAESRLGGVQAVVHCAGFKAVDESVCEPLKYYENNVAKTIVLLQKCSQFGTEQVLFSSSATVYGEPEPGDNPIKETHRLAPLNPYGHSKAMVEQIIADWFQVDSARRSAVLLRYMNPVGAHVCGLLGDDPSRPANLQPVLFEVVEGKRDKVLVFGTDYATRDGSGVRDYVHVCDVADAHVAALRHVHLGQCEAVNIGTGRGVSVFEMIAAVERATQQKIAFEAADRRVGDAAEVYCDVHKAQRLLGGWQATKTLDEMCADAWRFRIKVR